MRVALVSMPWAAHARPSAALGALQAWLQRERPELTLIPRSEHIRVAAALGFDRYALVENNAYSLGELLYQALLFPERREAARNFAAELALARVPLEDAPPPPETPDARVALLDGLIADLEPLLEEQVEEWAEEAPDVLALTTCFGQTFANLALSQRLNARLPELVVVMGGSTLSARVGPSVLRAFSWVDHVVQGEGELPLRALLDALAAGERPEGLRGVLSQGATAPAPLWEVSDLDALPAPDFDEYAALADHVGIDWALPLEGSRGCWWDRTRKTGNPRATCHFCNLNVQWSGYREKSSARVVAEVAALTERYDNTRVYFLDNILRARGVEALGRELAALGLDLDLFYEMRAHMRPWEILAMWEAGLRSAQFGIEALSDSLLRRVGKGTTVIQNLEVMKTCAELEIHNYANLITDFPGSTQAEVEETLRCIERAAGLYGPCQSSTFKLGVGSTVEQLPQDYGITSIRTAARARAGLPEDLAARLDLLDLDYEAPGPRADWDPVRRALSAWEARHRGRRERLLEQREGGAFLLLHDRREELTRVVLREATAEIYRAFAAVRPLEAVAEALRLSRSEVEDTVDRLCEQRLMWREGARALALAMAPDAASAARRIRAMAPVAARCVSPAPQGQSRPGALHPPTAGESP